jgi:putative transposase
MYIVVLAVELYKFGFKVIADFGEDALQVAQYLFCEHPASVLGHEDQVYMQLKYTMPAVSNTIVIFHRPKCIIKLRKAYKYELMPTGEQQRDMRRFAGSCRFVYNKARAIETANHEAENKFICYVEMANLLPAWRVEFARLKEAPSQALQRALKNLDRAFVSDEVSRRQQEPSGRAA